MKRLLIAAGLALTACSSMSAGAPQGPSAGADQCGASRYQAYVGRTLGQLPPKPAGAIWRTACTQCAVTMDFNPARMNVFFDQQSEVIREVRCG
ncbi:MAG: hemolysin [Caulobacteraceae bacterium]|nr:hemolysin [Caulobacteraceae bacterium]